MAITFHKDGSISCDTVEEAVGLQKYLQNGVTENRLQNEVTKNRFEDEEESFQDETEEVREKSPPTIGVKTIELLGVLRAMTKTKNINCAALANRLRVNPITLGQMFRRLREAGYIKDIKKTQRKFRGENRVFYNVELA